MCTFTFGSGAAWANTHRQVVINIQSQMFG